MHLPPEIWKECFDDAPRQNLKILSVLSKECSSIFQPLFYREMKFSWEKVPKIISMVQTPPENSVVSFFTHFPGSSRQNKGSWEEYIARIIRGGERFRMVSEDPRLAGFVRTCTIEGPGSFYPALIPIDPTSLTGVINGHYHRAIEAMSNSLQFFSNLRHLTIKEMDITRAMLQSIERASRLEDLTFQRCLFSENPDGAFNPCALSKLTFVLSECCILRGETSAPLWATHVAAILPRQTVKELTVKIETMDHLPELQIHTPLQTVGILPRLDTLSIPVPRDEDDAMALIHVLANSPALRSLKIQDPALDYHPHVVHEVPRYELHPIASSASPLLEHLVAPILWAEHLVPGRPIRTLTVLQTRTIDSDFDDPFYESYDLRELLQALSKTSSRIQELSLPFIDDKHHRPILSMIGPLFPHVTTLSLVLPDAGLEDAPKATPPSSPLPFEPESSPEIVEDSWTLEDGFSFKNPTPFVPPPPPEIEETVFQIRCNVIAELADVPDGTYDVAEPPETPFYPKMYHDWNEWRRPTWENTFSDDTFPGAMHYAATHPETRPLPATITTLQVSQHLINLENYGTPFYYHQQEKVLQQLSNHYPALREVIWKYATTAERFRHRWWLVDDKWALKA